MSGWDQKYDFQDWARDVQKEAESLQRTNKAARYIYLAAFVFFLVLAIVIDMGFFFGVAFFALLLVFNERLIWKLKKAGIK